MTGLCGCLIRRFAGLFGVVAAVALIAAPVALANNDTITAQATVQFSGVVDTRPSCTRRHAGDDRLGRRDRRTSTGTVKPATWSAAPTPTPRQGTYSGTVTLTGGDCSCGARTTGLLHGERQLAPPMFTQCPAVYVEQRLPVPDHGQQRHRDGPAGPQPGPLRGGGRLADRRAEQLVFAGFRAPALGPRTRTCSGSTATASAIPGGPPVPSGCVPQPGAPAGTACQSSGNQLRVPGAGR